MDVHWYGPRLYIVSPEGPGPLVIEVGVAELEVVELDELFPGVTVTEEEADA